MVPHDRDSFKRQFSRVWLDAAVHAYVLYMICQGYAAARELAQIQQAAQPGLSQPTLP